MAVALRAANETLEQRVAERTAVNCKRSWRSASGWRRVLRLRRRRNYLHKALIEQCRQHRDFCRWARDRRFRQASTERASRGDVRTIWRGRIPLVGASLLEIVVTDSALAPHGPGTRIDAGARRRAL
jgi:hypothetical protein